MQPCKSRNNWRFKAYARKPRLSTLPDPYQPASEWLATLDPDWARHIAAIGPCLHQPHPARDPYESLVRAIAYQQLHARAGDAIIGRLRGLFEAQSFPRPEQILATQFDDLRACGFSANKIATIQGIAQATLDAVVPDYATALGMDDEALIERLTRLRGVGRWTVEMLLIYSLERMDILPADDFGVREGYRRLKGWEVQPTRKQIMTIGLAWQPYRTVAAWYLWRVPGR